MPAGVFAVLLEHHSEGLHALHQHELPQLLTHDIRERVDQSELGAFLRPLLHGGGLPFYRSPNM